MCNPNRLFYFRLYTLDVRDFSTHKIPDVHDVNLHGIYSCHVVLYISRVDVHNVNLYGIYSTAPIVANFIEMFTFLYNSN